MPVIIAMVHTITLVHVQRVTKSIGLTANPDPLEIFLFMTTNHAVEIAARVASTRKPWAASTILSLLPLVAP